MDEIKNKFLITILFISLIGQACIAPENQQNKVSERELNKITGWWIYGEGQHILKDEETLDEFDLLFLDEDSLALIDLYLSITEMEYFPMEVEMTGVRSNDKLFSVHDFEIKYIQGCDEQ